jgi:hypothetical protein
MHSSYLAVFVNGSPNLTNIALLPASAHKNAQFVPSRAFLLLIRIICSWFGANWPFIESRVGIPDLGEAHSMS